MRDRERSTSYRRTSEYAHGVRLTKVATYNFQTKCEGQIENKTNNKEADMTVVLAIILVWCAVLNFLDGFALLYSLFRNCFMSGFGELAKFFER